MSTQGFTITKDHIRAGRAGTVVIVQGPLQDPAAFREVLMEEGVEFRAYDDDGILYFEGFCTDDDDVLFDAYRAMQVDVGITYMKINEKDRGWVPFP